MESGKIVAGKYRLNQLLGSGGMAEVWSATNTFTDRQVAIKFMHPQVAKTPEAATRFLKEAKVSARVNHPNVIDVIDVGQTEEGQLFLVMELLAGFPLEVGLRRQNPRMTAYEFVLVMTEVAQALSAAHKTGIIHRDLKPSNVFLHKIRDGIMMPKVLDFGVSKFLEDDPNHHALTVAGTVLGSPLYMSPEQARGEGQIDGRTDIFAFGAILFEGFSGFRPFEAANFNALIVKIATTKPKSIDETAKDAPESVRRVIRACLESDLKKRAKSFDDVLPMLRTALDELENSALQLPEPVATSAFDPEATNALPVVRASERAPASERMHVAGSIPAGPSLGGSASVPPGALSVPPLPAPGATGPSWHTPNTSYASTNPQTPAKARNYLVLAAGAAVLVGAGALIGGWWTGGSNRAQGSTTTGASVRDTVSSGATTTTAPAPSASSELATVSVDSLPRAAQTAPTPVPAGSGRLNVVSSPGDCTLFVDGKSRGKAPLTALDLPAGAHHLKCQSSNGKTRGANVTVQDGATSKLEFNF